MEKQLFDAAAERGLLSSLCQHGSEAYYNCLDILGITDFQNIENQLVYKCISTVIESEKLVDVTTIMSASKDLGIWDSINTESQLKYIKSLFTMPAKIENSRKHAIKIKKLSIARMAQQMHKSCFVELQNITGSETIDEILSISEKPLLDMSFSLSTSSETRPQQIAEGGTDLLMELMSNPVDNVGIPTPFARYNQAIGGGLRVGGVNLIAARPKCGKTTLGKEFALHVSGKLKVPVLFLDTEMLKTDQYIRSLASISRVKINDIETGKFGKNAADREKVFKADKVIQSIPYDHIMVAGKPFDEIISVIRRWIMQKVGFNDSGKANPCLVIYDYFKLMTAESLQSMDEYQALGFQISKLSDFSKLYGFSCLAFVQINRDGVTKETSDVLAGSDRLLWLCHSCSIFKRKTQEEIAQTGQYGNMKFIPLDCRFGPSMQEGDFIHVKMDGDISYIEESVSNREVVNNLDNNNESEQLD